MRPIELESPLRQLDLPGAELTREETLRLLESALHHANEGIVIATAPGESGEIRIVYASPAFVEMTGYTPDELAGESFRLLQGRETDPVIFEWVEENLAAGRSFSTETLVYRKDGSEFFVEWHGAPIPGDGGSSSHFVSILRDITERKEAEEALRRSDHDSLTGLPNRAFFMRRLDRCLDRANRQRGYRFAILFVDLDRFKVVNDSLGHLVGDRLLVGVARRLESSLRPGDTVARLGGDEFTVLVDDIDGIADAELVAERIHEALATPFEIEGHEIFTGASVGIAPADGSYETPEEVLRDADAAMYRAKKLGKARHQVFDGTVHDELHGDFELETELHRAVDRSEFTLHYQPVVDTEEERAVAVEALVRWRHPERGLLMPRDFLPLARETGLIVPMGQWVLREAIRQVRRWEREVPRAADAAVAVNLSELELVQPDLVETVEGILEEEGLDPHRLALEVTERALAGAGRPAWKTLGRLRGLGVRMILDRFGTGYTSLSLLHRMPLDTLKIDRDFVSGVGKDGARSPILRTIANLADTLGLRLIAAGVKTRFQLAQLRVLGIHRVQGPLFARPVDAGRTRALLERTFSR